MIIYKKKILLSTMTMASIVLLLVVGQLVLNTASATGKPKGVLEYYYGKKDTSLLEKYVKKDNICYKTDYCGYSIYIDEYIVDKCSGVGIIRYRVPRNEYDKTGNLINSLHVSKEMVMCENESIDESNETDEIYVYYDFVLNDEGKSKDFCEISYTNMKNADKVKLQFAILNCIKGQNDAMKILISPLGISIKKDGYISLNQENNIYEVLTNSEINIQYLKDNVDFKNVVKIEEDNEFTNISYIFDRPIKINSRRKK